MTLFTNIITPAGRNQLCEIYRRESGELALWDCSAPQTADPVATGATLDGLAEELGSGYEWPAYVDGEIDLTLLSAPAPAPRWTLAPGRWLCYDGKPMVALMLHQEKETGARNCQPHHADDLAHLLVYLLTGEAAKNHYYRPVEFPLSKGLADEARAVTPVTLPTA